MTVYDDQVSGNGKMRTESPPSYESAMHEGSSASGPSGPPVSSTPKLNPPAYPQPSPGPFVPPSPFPAGPNVHHYINPHTGAHVASLLPPDAPRMRCLQEGHSPRTSWGPVGILAALLWFPLGIGLCLLDRRVRCERCGERLEEGMCG